MSMVGMLASGGQDWSLFGPKAGLGVLMCLNYAVGRLTVWNQWSDINFE